MEPKQFCLPADIPRILLPGNRGRWRVYSKFAEIIQAHHTNEILPALAEVEKAVESGGLRAVGFLCYESAPAFDPAFVVAEKQPNIPLLWFAFAEEAEIQEIEAKCLCPSPSLGDSVKWLPSVDRLRYAENVERIRDYLGQGETYQVNYTYLLRTPGLSDPFSLFMHLASAQPSPYSAFIQTADWTVASASPELFFHLSGNRIVMKPMKGTSARGGDRAEDERWRATLQGSEKDRAENLMIVDMIRNDLGKIAQIGTVKVPSLFHVEPYPTVFQMTSTVEARTDSSLTDIFRAVFPCASITGAPKVNTMRIIAELEGNPRGVYCGCIGRMEPGRNYQFAVAIRTAVCDSPSGMAEYGVGGGVVWDSTAEKEWEESNLKAKILETRSKDFALIETMRWTPEEGWFLLDRHLRRLSDSAQCFGIKFDIREIEDALNHQVATFGDVPQRVRVLLSPSGYEVQAAELGATSLPSPYRLRLSVEPVDSHNPFLYHKTTCREVYDHAKRLAGDCDDVILWNERGELTESCIANLALRLEGKWFTPPVDSGLLGGTFRQMLLDQQELQERILHKTDLKSAEKICLVNSVRGWIAPCRLFQ